MKYKIKKEYKEINFYMVYLKERMERFKKYNKLKHNEMIEIFKISRASYYKLLNCDDSVSIAIYLKIIAYINDGVLKDIHINQFNFESQKFEDFNKKIGFYNLSVMKGYFWVSEQIKIAKKERKITYERLENLTKVSKNTIRNLIQKTGVVSCGEVFKLMDFFDIDLVGDGNSYKKTRINSVITNIPLIQYDEELYY